MSKKTILIVDDERNNINVLGGILKQDYKVTVAISGESALERAASDDPPDLILMDIMMPGMDGYEACKRLKSDERTKDIPIIFVTALDQIEDETKGLALGAVDYIAKPVSPSIVKARVKNHLALKSAYKMLEKQNQEFIKAAKIVEDLERMTRHDMKTPLNVIIAFPELIRMNPNLTEKDKEFLFMIEDAGKQILTMINLSLDVFRMERGTYSPDSQPINLLNMIEKIVKELYNQVNEKSLSVNITVNGNSPTDGLEFNVHGEKLLCYIMMSNLLKNAIEASPEKEQIQIDMRHDADMSIVRIHNIGAVPEAVRHNFFDKYSTYGKSKGTGLGTYSARLIAKTHGGAIEVDSSEEKGTTLTVKLPKI